MKKKNTRRRRSRRNETKPTKATNQNKNNKPKTENQALDNRRNGSVASGGQGVSTARVR